jgi:hypothetical protein
LDATRIAKEIMAITVEGPGGATVEFPDGTPAETINKVMTDHFGGGKKEASGTVAGMLHGAEQLAQGVSETAKQFAGVGKGRETVDPNYVPADVRGGSWNPLKWNYDQVPQAVAEQAPGLGADIAAGSLAAKAAKGAGRKYAALAGLAGAGLSAWTRTAGDTAKEAAVARTGDANAEPDTGDKTRGGLTAAASAGVSALLPTRFIPGMNKLNTVGAEGALDAAKRYLGTTALGAGGAGAADAITQAGTTIGTDKGLTVDPNRVGDAAVNGLFTAGTLASPKLAGDTVRASNMREFGGANADATKNYATRLETAGDGGLGNAKRDYTAHETVKTDLKNELRDAAASVRKSKTLSPEADNALQRAQEDKPLTPRDVEIIEHETAGTPDGANAAYLARTLHVAQLAQAKGSYSKNMWAGGISGTLDENLGYMLNPTRIIGGGIASLAGMHLLGLSNPIFAGSVAGGYAGARVLDSATGMRSPAKSFAEHFADQAAQLRKPQTPQAMPPQAPAPGPTQPWGPVPPGSGPTGPRVAPAPAAQAPAGPWGPRPLATTSVPPVAAPMPPAPVAPPAPAAPQLNPMALAMLKQKLKAGLPEIAPAPAAPAPEAPKPPQLSPLAVKMLQAKLKQGLPAEPQPAPAPVAPVTPSPVEPPAPVLGVPKDVAGNSKTLMAALAKVAKMKADALGGTGDPASLSSAAAPNPGAPKTMADILSNVNAQAAKPKTIKKTNGKVEAEAPIESPYEPLAEEHLYPKGITPKEYAEREAAAKGTRSDVYKAKAEASEKRRADIASDLTAKYPKSARAIGWLHRELQKVGVNPKEIARVVKHAQENVPDDVAKAMEVFK